MKLVTLLPALAAAQLPFASPVTWGSEAPSFSRKGQNAQQKQRRQGKCMSLGEKRRVSTLRHAFARRRPQQTDRLQVVASGFRGARAEQWAGA